MEWTTRAGRSAPTRNLDSADERVARGIGGGNTAPIDEFRRSCPGANDAPAVCADDVVGIDLRLIAATDHQRS